MSVAASTLEDWRVFGKPVFEVLELSFSAVVNACLVVLWIENKSWVSSDLNAVGLVGSCIELSNDNVLIILEMLTERMTRRVVRSIGSAELDRCAERVRDRDTDPYSLIEALLDQLGWKEPAR